MSVHPGTCVIAVPLITTFVLKGTAALSAMVCDPPLVI